MKILLALQNFVISFRGIHIPVSLKTRTVEKNPFGDLMAQVSLYNGPKTIFETTDEEQIFIIRENHKVQIIQQNESFLFSVEIMNYNSMVAEIKFEDNIQQKTFLLDTMAPIFNDTYDLQILYETESPFYFSFNNRKFSTEDLFSIVKDSTATIVSQLQKTLKMAQFYEPNEYSACVQQILQLPGGDKIRVKYKIDFEVNYKNELRFETVELVSQNEKLFILTKEEVDESMQDGEYEFTIDEEELLCQSKTAKPDIILVANYLLHLDLKRHGSFKIDPLKIQKLCYYAQSLHLGLYGFPLFDDDIIINYHGPFNRDLHNLYNGYFIREIKGNTATIFSLRIQKFLSCIFVFFNAFSGRELEYKSHQENLWKQKPLYSNISHEDMLEYFSKDVMLFFFYKMNQDYLEKCEINEVELKNNTKKQLNSLLPDMLEQTFQFYNAIANNHIILQLFSELIFPGLENNSKVLHIGNLWDNPSWKYQLLLCFKCKNCLAAACLLEIIHYFNMEGQYKQLYDSLIICKQIFVPTTPLQHLQLLQDITLEVGSIIEDKPNIIISISDTIMDIVPLHESNVIYRQ